MRHIVNGASFQPAGIRAEKKPGGSLCGLWKSPTSVGTGQRFGIVDPDEEAAGIVDPDEEAAGIVDPDADEVAEGSSAGSLATLSSALAFFSAFFCFLARIFYRAMPLVRPSVPC